MSGSGELKARFEAAAKEIAAFKPAGKDPSDEEKLVRGCVCVCVDSRAVGMGGWVDSVVITRVLEDINVYVYSSLHRESHSHYRFVGAGGVCALQAGDCGGLQHAQVSRLGPPGEARLIEHTVG
jgi:hypothetical protein